ncbi:uncharacterized protein LTR77_004186 [Saxophila tyrrhenica]|uniref:Uncharacterized protein n=1 Tax=Saxophila tyrrhenica TaxID=1690608 RepID=A0AAV9PFC7_9PEZI|nr:hypothetical protein LTR77_004186 [Saxophila tyrrhenica]
MPRGRGIDPGRASAMRQILDRIDQQQGELNTTIRQRGVDGATSSQKLSKLWLLGSKALRRKGKRKLEMVKRTEGIPSDEGDTTAQTADVTNRRRNALVADPVICDRPDESLEAVTDEVRGAQAEVDNCQPGTESFSASIRQDIVVGETPDVFLPGGSERALLKDGQECPAQSTEPLACVVEALGGGDEAESTANAEDTVSNNRSAKFHLRQLIRTSAVKSSRTIPAFTNGRQVRQQREQLHVKATMQQDPHRTRAQAIPSPRPLRPNEDAILKRKAVEQLSEASGAKAREASKLPVSWTATQDGLDPKMFPSLPSLSDKTVKTHHGAVWQGILSLSHKYFQDTGIDPSSRPEFCRVPEGQLQALYQQPFGERWQAYVCEMVHLEKLKAVGVIQGCIGAAIKRHAPYITQLMRYHEAQHTFPEIALLAEQTMLADRKFQQEVIRAEAERLAGELSLTLEPQLLKLGVRKTAKQADARAFWQQCQSDLVDIFQSALVLKGLLLAAPDESALEWVARGAEVDRNTMVEANKGREPFEVLWCISPVVRVGSSPEQEWRVVSPATVQSIKKSESEN